jgi:hypothetical protein
MKATEGWQLANVIATITRVWSALMGIDARVIDDHLDWIRASYHNCANGWTVPSNEPHQPSTNSNQPINKTSMYPTISIRHLPTSSAHPSRLPLTWSARSWTSPKFKRAECEYPCSVGGNFEFLHIGTSICDVTCDIFQI